MSGLIPVTQNQGKASTELITCRVGDQWLGLLVQQVREIVVKQSYTEVPLAPKTVSGLINLRGKVMTQIELRAAMGLPERGEDELYHVAIIETFDGEDFGMMVDEVGEVISMNASEYEPAPKTLPAIWRRVSNGVLKQDNRVLVLVDVERLIALTLPQQADKEVSETRTIH